MYDGVYVVSGSPDTWQQRLMAACLWARDGVVSHFAAGGLYGFPRVWKGRLEVSTSRSVRSPSKLLTVHCQRRIAPIDRCLVGALPVTTPTRTRTLIDLTPTMKPLDLKSSLDSCLGRELTSITHLQNRITALFSGQYLRPLCELAWRYAGGEAPSESELEAKAYDLLDGARLPRPVMQKRFDVGRFVRFDFYYPSIKLVLEVDGYLAHHTMEKLADDTKRRNAVIVTGYFPITWTWTAMRDDPAGCIAEVRSFFARSERARSLYCDT